MQRAEGAGRVNAIFFAQIKAKRIAFVAGSLAVTIKPALLGVLGQ